MWQSNIVLTLREVPSHSLWTVDSPFPILEHWDRIPPTVFMSQYFEQLEHKLFFFHQKTLILGMKAFHGSIFLNFLKGHFILIRLKKHYLSQKKVLAHKQMGLTGHK